MISIIVPVYNAQSTLRRCLDSILSQDYTDYEVLVIDDGSKDDSPAICDEYAAKDSRFRVFHKSNGGVSSARNVGLDNAIGEWITFADSDDMFEDGAFSMIYNSITQTDSSCNLIVENVEMIHYDGRKSVVYKSSMSSLADLIASGWYGSVWNKMFRNRLLHSLNLRFDEELHFGEDQLFVAEYLQQVDKISYIKFPCYIQYLPQCYRKKYEQYTGYNYHMAIYRKIKKINPSYACTMVDGLTMSFIGHLRSDKVSYSEEISSFKEYVGEDVSQVKGKRKFALRWLSGNHNLFVWKIIFTIYSRFNL